MNNKNTIDKFFKKIEKTNSCWIWQGSKFNSGYGRIVINHKTYRAHRLSYEIHNGPIPEKMLVCHSCDNKVCVNPSHLWLGTSDDNMKDMIRKKRSLCGSKNPKSRFSEDQIIEIRTLAKSGELSQREIGKIYNIEERYLSRILLRHFWTHI